MDKIQITTTTLRAAKPGVFKKGITTLGANPTRIRFVIYKWQGGGWSYLYQPISLGELRWNYRLVAAYGNCLSDPQLLLSQVSATVKSLRLYKVVQDDHN